jgi:hypothetical protein
MGKEDNTTLIITTLPAMDKKLAEELGALSAIL